MNKKILAAILVVSIIIFCIILYNKTLPYQSNEKEKTKKQFIPSATFKGKKKGYVFKTENNKTGYYIDTIKQE